MAREVLVVRGIPELLRAATVAGSATSREVRAALRESGEIVRKDAAGMFQKYDAKSAAGFKVRVRQRGVAVEQSLRKTTGRRPDYGALQMKKALIPSLEDNESTVEAEMEKALDKIALIFNA